MCGLGGIISLKKRPFDFATFCTLGIANDSRGGDSCGIFIDGYYEYGTGKYRYFQDFFFDNDYINSLKESQIALVHCRKASVGIIDESTAQPVVIKEGDEVKYVLMHNGTIYNYEELADKYIPEINIKGMTDSQVMAHIFYHSGYQALGEYNGSGAFVMVDYRKKDPLVMFFVGESKHSEYYAKSEYERPLYYCIDPDNKELVFSSIWPYLCALRRDLNTYLFTSNTLVAFTGTKLVRIQKFDRSQMTYTKAKKTDTFYGYTVGNNYISINLLNNTYTYQGKRAQGCLRLNDYGRVGDNAVWNSYPIWFFYGCALDSEEAYNFLSELCSKLSMSPKAFYRKYENLVRYLSADSIYPINGIWYIALSPNEKELFTGSYNPLTSVNVSEINKGKVASIRYDYSSNSLSNRTNLLKINFKQLEKQCKSMINSLDN